MFGSQVLETAIGLAAMFFVLATAASAVTETVSRLIGKRAKDLERGIRALLAGEPASTDVRNLLEWSTDVAKRTQSAGEVALPDAFKNTSIWKASLASAGLTLWRRKERNPSYLSAKAFAEATLEALTGPEFGGQPINTSWPPELANLQKRIRALQKEGRDDLLSFKAGLESWYDEAMSRVAGAYKRWATVVLFGIGLILAVCLNVSTISVASSLWQDPVTREAVANAAGKLATDGGGSEGIETLAETTDQLEALQIPGGWRAENRQVWSTAAPGHGLQRLEDVAGWLLTGLLVMLGGPFWFDLLGRLVSLRGSGAKPPTATADPASATATTASTALSTVSPAGPPTKTLAEVSGAVFAGGGGGGPA